MTRFTDRLENDLEQIADRATPSPTAWQSIRHRMAEPDTTQAREIIMLTAERQTTEDRSDTRRRNWLAVAAATAIAAIATGVIIGSGGSKELDVTDQPPTESSVPASTTSTVETNEPPVGQVLPGFTLNPGPYQTDTLGMKVQFDVAEAMRTTWLAPGEFQLIDQETESRFVVIARIGGWYTLEEAVDRTLPSSGSIAPTDIDAWIADNQLISTRREDAVVDGRPAMVFDVRLDPEVEGSLADGGRMTLVYSVPEPSLDPSAPADTSRGIVPDLAIRLWLIDVDGFDPIAIFAASSPPAPGAAVTDEETVAWLDEFEATMLPTIDFGPDGPSAPR